MGRGSPAGDELEGQTGTRALLGHGILGPAQILSDHGWAAFGHTTGPQTVYNRDTVAGWMPHLPANPGNTRMNTGKSFK